jgi:pSer/pThr/pTyr-binding forkhead associated (FHA) protein
MYIMSSSKPDLELFHIQSNARFKLSSNQGIIQIGKQGEEIPSNIDVTHLPHSDIVSRIHAQIKIEEDNYYLVDPGSTNGTYLNHLQLELGKRYLLKLGDIISLGKEEKVSFIFQNHQNPESTKITPSQPTVFQPELAKHTQTNQVNKTSRLVGLALMVTSVIIIAANTQIGIFVRIPGVILCIAGTVFLFQRRFNKNWGWLLIAVGIAIILFTANIFASVNLLAIIAAIGLFLAGYKLNSTGKVLGYSLQDLQHLLKNKLLKNKKNI